MNNSHKWRKLTVPGTIWFLVFNKHHIFTGTAFSFWIIGSKIGRLNPAVSQYVFLFGLVELILLTSFKIFTLGLSYHKHGFLFSINV